MSKEVFKVWAPIESKWSKWVKPVLFVNSVEVSRKINLEIPKINYLNDFKKDVAIILDLPGYESINEGLALAKLGYKLVPLFNGTTPKKETMAVVDNESIQSALILALEELQKAHSEDIQPVFLLDSNRVHRYRMSKTIFDNSWDIYDQDFPTAEYFLQNGITKIIVRAAKIQKDLRKVLYSLQKKSIEIYFSNGFEAVKKVSIKKPPKNNK